MAEAPTSKKRKRGTPNPKTGLIGVYKSSGDKYTAMITYGGKTNHLGSFDTKEEAGIAYSCVWFKSCQAQLYNRVPSPR